MPIRQAQGKQKITPFLWFDKEAEEAMNFYVEVFNGAPNKRAESKVIDIIRYEEGMNTPGMPEMLGKVITGTFELAGQQFMALDGGPIFKFTEAMSLLVDCDGQEEVDYFMAKLSAVPESEQCGWIKDKYGMSWQIIPKQLGKLLGGPDKEKAMAATNAMLQMKKIDIAGLQKAYDEG